MMSEKEFPERLKALRQERELTLEMMAEDMNRKYGLTISKGTISRWEGGNTDPAMTYVVCIADYFNVSIDYLAGLTDSKLPARLLAYAKGVRQMQKGGCDE